MPKHDVYFPLSNGHYLHVRLSDKATSNLAKYAQEHNHKNTTEALEQILSDKLLSPREQASEGSGAPDPLPDVLKCRRRIEFKGNYLCVNKPPKAVELVSLEVCKVCKAANIGLSDSTKLDVPTEETFNRPRQPVTDPDRADMNKAGMVWCPDGGFWVFPKKCEMCQDKTYPRWYECQKQQLRKKGELQRASTASSP